MLHLKGKLIRPKQKFVSFHFSPETGEPGSLGFFSFFFSFSDKLIFRREDGPSSLLCILTHVLKCPIDLKTKFSTGV
jgi:hypothetical protein